MIIYDFSQVKDPKRGTGFIPKRTYLVSCETPGKNHRLVVLANMDYGGLTFDHEILQEAIRDGVVHAKVSLVQNEPQMDMVTSGVKEIIENLRELLKTPLGRSIVTDEFKDGAIVAETREQSRSAWNRIL
jgi:hypothetical protein